MPPKELWEAYSNCTVRPCVCPSVPLHVRCISPRFFEVGIPNLVCGYILGWRSVAYHFRVTVTLTSDLVFRIIMSRAYPLGLNEIYVWFLLFTYPNLFNPTLNIKMVFGEKIPKMGTFSDFVPIFFVKCYNKI